YPYLHAQLAAFSIPCTAGHCCFLEATKYVSAEEISRYFESSSPADRKNRKKLSSSGAIFPEDSLHPRRFQAQVVFTQFVVNAAWRDSEKPGCFRLIPAGHLQRLFQQHSFA